MKKIDLGLDYDAIRKRIELDKAHYKPGEWARLIGVRPNTVSNIHSPTVKQPPSLQYLIAVSNATGKSMEWYLYGEADTESKTPPNGQTAPKEKDPLRTAITARYLYHHMIDLVYDAGHPEDINVLQTGIRRILAGLQKEAMSEENKARIQYLMDDLARQKLPKRSPLYRKTKNDGAAKTKGKKSGGKTSTKR